jgi:hypothetical protein
MSQWHPCFRYACNDENEIPNAGLESVATRLIAKYPDGYLFKPSGKYERWRSGGPDVDGLYSPKAIIRGSYREIRGFELAYHRIKSKRSPIIVDDRIAMEA